MNSAYSKLINVPHDGDIFKTVNVPDIGPMTLLPPPPKPGPDGLWVNGERRIWGGCKTLYIASLRSPEGPMTVVCTDLTSGNVMMSRHIASAEQAKRLRPPTTRVSPRTWVWFFDGGPPKQIVEGAREFLDESVYEELMATAEKRLKDSAAERVGLLKALVEFEEFGASKQK